MQKQKRYSAMADDWPQAGGPRRIRRQRRSPPGRGPTSPDLARPRPPQPERSRPSSDLSRPRRGPTSPDLARARPYPPGPGGKGEDEDEDEDEDEGEGEGEVVREVEGVADV